MMAWGWCASNEVGSGGSGTTGILRREFLTAPESSSWLMLVAGAAFLGALYRQRALGLRVG